MEISLADVNQVVNGEIVGDPGKKIRGIAPFEAASIHDITFAESPKLLKRIGETHAGAVIVPLRFNQDVPANLIKCANPRLGFARIMSLFFPPVRSIQGVSSHASIGENVSFGADAAVGPTAVIQNDVVIGSRVYIHPQVVIGDGVRIGDDVEIYPHVAVLDRCVIGSRVIIHAGTVIGGDGFGFVPDGERH
ncbi:MAG: UDP-3-O-(3-hydroxymyristoyl)glucosamine N-acyltransferase, partial [Desulfobacteraceae bacterium]|nr:UDP-3-O-(3-hydroxymyristoyl)glucosamine N-acyltransferase [Desulfobacteraceae bacterium]